MKNTKLSQVVVLSVATLVVLAGVGASAYCWGNKNSQEVATTVHDHEIATTDEIRESLPKVDETVISKSDQMTQDLQYLIEEEKLAHDVYQTLYERWGFRTFGNIKQSELSHQNNVLAVMEVRDVEDVRIDEVGKFVSSELQTLYDKLVADGSKSAEAALNVGVTIEEMDIKDLKAMMAKVPAKDADVKAVMEHLLAGSERHLDAFNRQFSRL